MSLKSDLQAIMNYPVAAEVRADTESEAFLIQRAKKALSASSWEVGECASMWTERWSKGRTDDDFGAAVGMTGDQVGQRRRVWDRFGSKSDTYQFLSWSHCYAALNWEDADTYLDWACANQATVAEMKAYRTAMTAQEFLPPAGERGGDPFVDATDDDDPFAEGEGSEAESAERVWRLPSAGIGSEADEGEEGGTETEGTDSEEEQPPRRRRSGTEEPAGEVDPEEVKQTLKAKAVKTLEAGSRVIGDLHEVDPSPQDEAMIKALHKMIGTVKSRNK